MIETITEEQLTPQQAEFWVRARQAVDMNNYPYAVSLLKALGFSGSAYSIFLHGSYAP